MSFPNISDIAATTIQSRRRKLADNVTKQNALYARLSKRGNISTVSGGEKIYEELMYAENGNGGWYSGYDLLPVAQADIMSAAEYAWKQLAVPVIVSGLEKRQNSGREKLIDLIVKRVTGAEATMMNKLGQGAYADGTGTSGKELTGLGAGVVASPSTGTYGAIDRASWPFWRNYATGSLGAQTVSNIQTNMNKTYANVSRGPDTPDLIVFDNNLWALFVGSLQLIQRFAGTETADLGFPSVKFMGADVVLDGGVGGFQATNVGHFLNTKYLFLRPHADLNMVPLDPEKRSPVNQDAEVTILGWMGNMTCSNASLQGYFQGS